LSTRLIVGFDEQGNVVPLERAVLIRAAEYDVNGNLVSEELAAKGDITYPIATVTPPEA